jgi:hypothetical protein
VLAFFSMVVAAAEVVVGLAIIVSIYRRQRSVDVDEVRELRPRSLCSRANATSVRFTAFSCSSTDMKIRSALRLINTPTVPSANSTPARIRKYAIGVLTAPP